MKWAALVVFAVVAVVKVVEVVVVVMVVVNTSENVYITVEGLENFPICWPFIINSL